MVLVALYQIVRESFQLYSDICEVLAVLLDRFFDMEYAECVKAFEAYASAAKQIDELSAFYAWCKDTGVARSSEYPEVQRVTDKLLETLEKFMMDRAFPSNGGNEVTSAWQNPAAEPGKADWELALVETTSNLSMQKPAMSSGMDPLLLKMHFIVVTLFNISYHRIK
jgi:hypothetical protein